jgi:hypothetical protein
MTLGEAKIALSGKLNIDYAKIAQNALFSDSELGAFVQTGASLSWAYHRWDFTEDALKFLWDGIDAYFDYPNVFEDRSIFLLTVNDQEWGKRNFADFKRYMKQNPTSTEEIWAEFKRQYHLNTNPLVVSDEICVYGKLRAPILALSTDLLPFSPENDNDENSGNSAVIDLAFSEALGSEKKKAYTQADAEKKKAYAKLDILWAPSGELESIEQHQDRPFFENVPDFFRGSNGHPTSIGNFP